MCFFLEIEILPYEFLENLQEYRFDGDVAHSKSKVGFPVTPLINNCLQKIHNKFLKLFILFDRKYI